MSVTSQVKVALVASKPIITPELIEYLEEHFPDRVPDPMDPDRDIWMAVGGVRVVRHLKRMLKDQEENILET